MAVRNAIVVTVDSVRPRDQTVVLITFIAREIAVQIQHKLTPVIAQARTLTGPPPFGG